MSWEDVSQSQTEWEDVIPAQAGWEDVAPPKKKAISLPKIGKGIVRAVLESPPAQVVSSVIAGTKGKRLADLPKSALEFAKGFPGEFKEAQKAGGRAGYEFATFIPRMAIEFVKDPIETINNKPVETAMLFTAVGGVAGKTIKSKLSKGQKPTAQEITKAIEEIEYIKPEGGMAHAGEAVSAEAISRPMEFSVVDTGTGKQRPLVGVDAVDYVPKKKEIKIQKNTVTGKTEIADAGELVPESVKETIRKPLAITREQMGMSLEEFDLAQERGDILGIVAPGFAPKPQVPPEVGRIRGIIQDEPSVLGVVKEAVAGVAKKPSKIVHKAAFEFVDRYDPFRRWDETILDSLRSRMKEDKLPKGSKAYEIAEQGIPVDESAYNLLQARGGAGGIAENAFYDLQRMFGTVGNMPKSFTDYMVSMRLMERDLRGISNPGGIKHGEALAAWEKIQEGWTDAQKTRGVFAARMFYQWADKNIIQRFVDASMLDKKGAEKIRQANHHWLPFQKFTAKQDILKFLNEISFENLKDGQDFTHVVGKKLFELEGMEKNAKILDPWQAVLERLSAAIAVTERNKALLEFVKKSQLSPETRRWVRRVHGDNPAPEHMGTFAVVVNGRTQKWSAPLDIFESIKTLQAKDVSFISNLMGHTKQAFVVGTTGLNIPFGLYKNPVRDIWTSAVTAKYGLGPLSYLNGLANSLAANFGFPTKLYKEYLGAHASFGQFFNRAPRLKAKELFLSSPRLPSLMKLYSIHPELPKALLHAHDIARQVINPLNLARGIAKSIEMAPRVASFERSLRGIKQDFPNMTPQQQSLKAGLLARRSTIDFHRAGDFVKTVNYFVPFVNAKVQSTVITLEALFSKSGIREGKSRFLGIKGDPRAIAGARVAAFIVTPALAAYLYNRLHHSEAYDRVPDEVKERNIVIMTGNSSADPDTGQVKPEAILIPKTDAHQIFWNPAESLLEWAWMKKPQDILNVAANFFSNISPVQFEREGKLSLSRAIAGVTPPILQAPVSIATNKDFYWDRPLVPERLAKVAPEEQYTSYTPTLYKRVGAELGASPIKIQKMAESLVGGVARTPSPATIAKGFKETIVRRVGKELGNDAYDIDNKATSGYETARIRAERLSAEGKVTEARAIMRQWNSDLIPYLKKMAEAVGKPPMSLRRSGWYRQLSFSPEDMRNAIKRGRKKPVSSIKRRLGID